MTQENIHFRLIQMPCCGQLLCWVNPRLPNFCPECSKPILMILRTNGSQILLSDKNAWVKYTPIQIPVSNSS